MILVIFVLRFGYIDKDLFNFVFFEEEEFFFSYINSKNTKQKKKKNTKFYKLIIYLEKKKHDLDVNATKLMCNLVKKKIFFYEISLW